MKTSKNSLIAVLTIGVAVLASSSATAGGFSFGGGGGGGNKGGNKGSMNFKFNSGHNHDNHNHNHHKKYSSNWHHGHYDHYHVRYVKPATVVYSQCYHPQFQSCYVYPGDTWYTISKRIYGVDFLCKHIASYNGLSMGSPLVAGQMLQLPVVNANGSLAASTAPMPTPFVSPTATAIPQGVPSGMAPQTMQVGLNSVAPMPTSQPTIPEQNFSTTPVIQPVSAASSATIRTVSDEPTRPRVAIGSTLELDGDSLGAEKGTVRLRINSLSLPVEVLEWNSTTVKIQLPKMDLTAAMNAELEVVRADGSVASSSGIELTPAATRLALGN